jgi:hypothetical protein
MEGSCEATERSNPEGAEAEARRSEDGTTEDSSQRPAISSDSQPIPNSLLGYLNGGLDSGSTLEHTTSTDVRRSLGSHTKLCLTAESNPVYVPDGLLNLATGTGV